MVIDRQLTTAIGLQADCLQAEILDLKANPKAEASGIIIESQVDVCRGPLATVIVQRGTLPEHAAFCATAEGQRRIKASAKVRAMTDGEVAQLTAAIDRLAERGLVDPELVPGYQKYLEATRLGIVEGTVQTPGGPDA